MTAIFKLKLIITFVIIVVYVQFSKQKILVNFPFIVVPLNLLYFMNQHLSSPIRLSVEKRGGRQSFLDYVPWGAQWWHNCAGSVKKALTAAEPLLLQATHSQHEVHAVMLTLWQVQQMKLKHLCWWSCPLMTLLASLLWTSCTFVLSLGHGSYDADIVSVNVNSNL